MWAPTTLYRPQTKTRGSYLIGAHFDLQRGGFYEALRAQKREKLEVFWGPLGSSQVHSHPWTPSTLKFGFYRQFYIDFDVGAGL